MECGQPRSLVWLLFVLVLLASPPAAAEACGGPGRHLGGRQVLRGTVSKPMQSGDSESSVLKGWTHCSGVPQVGAALGSEAASGFVHRPVWSRRLLQLASGKAVHQDLSRRRQNLVRAVRIAGSASATPPQVAAGSGGGASLNKGVIVIIVLVPSFFIIIMVATALAWMCRRTDTLDQQTRKPSFQGHVDEPDNANRALSFGPWLRSLNGTSIARKAGAPVPTAVELEYSLLQVATNDFSVENLLGEGGFGSVYKAQLDEKSFAAVKKLAEDSGQGEKEFQSEVDLMSKVRHPNLVSLLGFCTNGDDRLLVYEYMQNGSLQDQLHGPTKGSALGWHMRIKIALDAARGLEHLHEHCDPPVIHRDFKSSNILLDANFNAKVSDFGLALPMPSGLKKDTSLQLRGTFGYVAPEYFLTGALTEKSDVYGFGVVLLELLTGRTPVDTSKPIGCQSLVTWATPQLTIRSKLPLLLDPVLRDSMNIKHLYQVAAVAALCVQTEPSYRPLIADVVHSLVPLVPVEFGGALRTGDSGPDAKKNAVHAII